MVFVLFYVGGDRFVVEAQKLIEVVPLVKLNKLSNTPGHIAGLCNYRALPVPVVDVRVLVDGELSRQVLSTRILLVNYTGQEWRQHILGLIVEEATETITLDINAFHKSSVKSSEGSFVSNVMTDERGIIQWMDVDQLLSQHDCDFLYGSHDETVE